MERGPGRATFSSERALSGLAAGGRWASPAAAPKQPVLEPKREPCALLPPGESKPPSYVTQDGWAQNKALALLSPLPPSPTGLFPSPTAPRSPFQSRRELETSHFPERRREPGPNTAQNRAAFTGLLAEAPLLGNKQAQKERAPLPREQEPQLWASGEEGRDLKKEVGCPPEPSLEASVAGWGGRPGMNYPPHQLWGFQVGG